MKLRRLKVVQCLVVFLLVGFASSAVADDSWEISSKTYRYWRPHNTFSVSKVVDGKEVAQPDFREAMNNDAVLLFADIERLERKTENLIKFWEVHFRGESLGPAGKSKTIERWVARVDSIGFSEVRGDFAYLPRQDRQFDAFVAFNGLELKPITDEAEVDASEIESGTEMAKLAPLDADDPLTVIGRDLTLEATTEEGIKLYGRDKKLSHLVRRLTRRMPGAILTGESGVGKTALINELARRMIHEPESLPEGLRNHRIVSIDIANLKGQEGHEFVSKMQQTFNSILQSAADPSDGRPVILVFDEIHQLVGAGTSRGNSNGLEQTFKTFMQDHPNVKILGGTTTKEFQKFISQDTAFVNRFGGRSIDLEELSQKKSLQAMERHAPTLESRYGVRLTKRTMKDAMRLADEYTGGTRPGNALKLVEAGSQLLAEKIERGSRDADKNKLTLSLLERAVREETNIPTVGDAFRQTILTLGERLRERVFGQDHVIDAIQEAYTNRFVNQQVEGAIGAFIFVGPSGTGKTEVVKALAEAVTGSEANLIRINLSEVRDIGQIIGDQDNLGIIHEVRANPFSVLLLDEIDRASNRVRDLFFAAADDGVMRDYKGEIVSFRNTVIAGTTNAGLTEAGSKADRSMGFVKGENEDIAMGEEALRNSFDHAFLARFQPYIFKEFTDETRTRIAKLRIAQLAKTYRKRHRLKLEVSDAAIDFIVEKAPRGENGRSIKKFVKSHVDSVLAKTMIRYEHETSKKKMGTVRVDTKRDASDGSVALAFSFPKRTKEYFASTSKVSPRRMRERLGRLKNVLTKRARPRKARGR